MAPIYQRWDDTEGKLWMDITREEYNRVGTPYRRVVGVLIEPANFKEVQPDGTVISVDPDDLSAAQRLIVLADEHGASTLSTNAAGETVIKFRIGELEEFSKAYAKGEGLDACNFCLAEASKAREALADANKRISESPDDPHPQHPSISRKVFAGNAKYGYRMGTPQAIAFNQGARWWASVVKGDPRP